jgi:hypothetical protein
MPQKAGHSCAVSKNHCYAWEHTNVLHQAFINFNESLMFKTPNGKNCLLGNYYFWNQNDSLSLMNAW